MARETAGRMGGSAAAAQELWRYAGRPRYWPTWLLIGWLKASARLPLRWSVRLHRRIGRTLWRVAGRRRAALTDQLAACLPSLPLVERTALTRDVFENLAAGVAELAAAWFGNPTRLQGLFRIEGAEHLADALAHGRGVIAFSGHFTPLELCAPIIKTLVPHFAFMYSRRRNPLLDEFQRRGRARAGHASFPSDDVRSMLRALSRNGVVWYAPDQTPGRAGERVQLFARHTRMSSATSRVARISGAAVVPFFFCRSQNDGSYILRFEPPLLDFPSGDLAADTQCLATILERFIAECPAQYLWSVRKFERLEHDATRRESVAGSSSVVPAEQTSPRGVFGIVAVILAIPLFITVFDNDALWGKVASTTSLDEHRLAILGSLFAIQVGTLIVLLACVPTRLLLKTVAAVLLLVAAVCGYFMNEYGALIDTTMIRNIAETTLQESAPLLTGSFLRHFVLFGIVPSAAVVSIPLARPACVHGLVARAVIVAFAGAGIVTTVYANYGPVSFFAHQQRQVRLLMNPSYPIYAYIDYLFRSGDAVPVERAPLDAHLSRSAALRKEKTVVVFVMGETARADHLQYNGYGRETNAYTSAYSIVNYPDVTACGTSTADSVPCIFSSLDRKQFTHAAAAHRESLLGTFERLGIEVFWRDNSTGCKNVCDPERFEQYASAHRTELCDDTGCFDEILLEGLDELLSDPTRDHLIVLHQRGSHGPAYHTDVPSAHKVYFPECDQAVLRNCDTAEINNAYDNTILYTDYFLSRVIERLIELASEYDVAMFYVSDHGESLGENGLYLHGFPYQLAPEEQLKVPMLFWASRSFYASRGLDPACLQKKAQAPIAHDAVFHTLIALYGIESSEYRETLDLFAACRNSTLSPEIARHESRRY